FVPHDALWSVHDLAGDFLAAMRWQAVHEHCRRVGDGHHFGIDAPVGESLAALFVLGFIAHAGPDIGGDQMRAPAGVQGIGELLQDVACRFADTLRLELVALGGGYMQLEFEDFGGLQPGIGHVVAVAYPGHGLAFDGPEVLDEGEDIGQDLAGVEFVGQPIDDGYARVRRKALYAGLFEGSDHDQIDHARDHARGVFDGLGAPKLRVASGKMDD